MKGFWEPEFKWLRQVLWIGCAFQLVAIALSAERIHRHPDDSLSWFVYSVGLFALVGTLIGISIHRLRGSK